MNPVYRSKTVVGTLFATVYPYLRVLFFMIILSLIIISSLYLALYSVNPVLDFIPDSLNFRLTLLLFFGTLLFLVVFYSMFFGLYSYYFFFLRHRSLIFNILVFSSFIIVSSIVGESVYSWHRSEEEKINRADSVKSAPTPSVNETENWRVYINNTYNYSLKYPPKWIITENKNKQLIIEEPNNNSVPWYPGKFEVSAGKFNTHTLDEWAKNLDDPGEKSYDNTDTVPGRDYYNIIGDITIGGLPAKQLSIFKFDSTGILTITVHRNINYEIVYNDGGLNDPKKEQHNQIYNQILSTFKFLPDTSKWKIYQNNKFGYEFKYPDNLKVTEKNNSIILNHSIPYENYGDCDMVVGNFSKYLNDFNVTFELKVSKEIELPSYFDGNYQSGRLNGKWYWAGAEGCGPNIYYFPQQGDKTLVITQDTLQAFSGISTMWNMDKILSSPGVIKQKEYDELLSQILSTFRIIETITGEEEWKEKISSCIDDRSYLYSNLSTLLQSYSLNSIQLNIKSFDTQRACITLPEDMYPSSNRAFTSVNNAWMGYVSNLDEGCRGIDIRGPDGNCTGEGYQAGGNGTVVFEAKGSSEIIPDIKIVFNVKEDIPR